MKKIGLFYGSSLGKTAKVAEKIQAGFGKTNIDIFDIKTIDPNQIVKYDNLIFGTSAWGVGDMQDDWESFIDTFIELDLSGKKIALFGLGDQHLYPESFADGMGTLYCRLKNKEDVVGFWPVEGYKYYFSSAEKDGIFVGLPLDEENQSKLSDDRIKKWIDQLKKEFK